MPKAETIMRMCKVMLTDAQLLELGKEGAGLVQQVRDLEGQKAAITADYAGQIKRVQLELGEASRKIRDGYVMENIECEVIRDFVRKRFSLVRTDTGETVFTRTMRAEEMQMDVFNPDAAPDAGAGFASA